jgi:DNA-binding SARP family transcriptional activator
VKFSILGPLRVTAAGREVPITSARQRAVLAVLALRAQRVVAVPQLLDAVWGECPPPSAHRLVQTYIWQLRRLLGSHEAAAREPRIVSHPDGYLLRVAPDELDAHAFEQLADDAEKALVAGDGALASRLLADALALWSGEPLAGTHLGGSAVAETRRLCEMRIRALTARIGVDLRLGRHAELIPELRALIAEEPLHEQLHAHLMVALSRSGRRGAALQAYASARQLLLDELGVEPCELLRQVQQDVLSGEPGLQPLAAMTLPPGKVQSPVPDRAGIRASRAGKQRRRQLVPRQLPAPIRYFTGRAAELKTLDSLLAEAMAPGVAVAAISGTAGVGKTSLAVHWAHSVAHLFPDGQLYVNLRGFHPSGRPVAPREAIFWFLIALGLPPERIPADFEARVGLYRSSLAGKRVLMVLDNARDASQARSLLPGAPGSVVIVTSRNQVPGLVATNSACPIVLDVLTKDETYELLAKQLGRERAASDPRAAAEVAALCARLPLALSLATAHAVTNPSLPLAHLAAQLGNAQRRLDTLDAGEPTMNMRTVFACSYRNLTEPAARLFRLLGLHPGPDVSVPAAASLAGIPVDQARAALVELTGVNLLTEHAPARYSFHDLLRMYAAERARSTDGTGERRAAIHRILDHYLHTAYTATLKWDRPVLDPPTLDPPQPGVTPEEPISSQALAWFRAEHQVLPALIDLAAENTFDTHIWPLAWALSRFLERQGHWQAWAAMQRSALAAATRLADQSAQAGAYLHLGRASTRLGQGTDAYRYCRRALDLYRQSGDRAGQALTHLNLCLIQANEGRLSTALRHATQALRLYEALGHLNGQANAHNDIGSLQASLGDHQQALTSSELALTLGRESSDYFCEACAWDSLGYAHYNLGNHQQAITCYQRALELFRNLGDRFNENVVLTHLGETQHALGDAKGARKAWLGALAILDELRHPGADEMRTRISQFEEGIHQSAAHAIPGATSPAQREL